MTPETRIEIIRLACPEKSSVGVELGVSKGRFSDEILSKTDCLHLYSIDRWNDKNHPVKQYLETIDVLRKHRGRSTVVRALFSEALTLFPQESLDFVYVDGYAHTGQENGQTLTDWWPKVRSGGIFCGHDYCTEWPLTVKAVDEFVARADVARPLNVTKKGKGEPFLSWWIRK